MKIANWLKGHEKVKQVYYVGLKEHPGYGVNASQASGFGSMISFKVDSEATARKLLESVKLIAYAESLGGVESLITYPMLQTHGDLPVEVREKLGITEDFLRLSVGIENADDLIADQSVPEFSLLDCETVDNRGFNLPAVPETVRGDGVKIGNDFTADVQVRRAINLAIDRQEMIDHVLNGYGSPAYSVCDKMPWYNDEMEKISYDVEKAEEMLDAAGWKKNADGIREKGGVKAILEFLYPTGDSVRQALAADTAQQLKEIGIDTSIRGTGWDTAYDEAQSQPLLWGWGAHTPMEFYNIYHTKADTGLAEYSPYANETVDAYMDEALAAPDLESSYELWKKAQWDGETGVSAEGDLPWIWLVNVDHLYWVRDGLHVAEQKVHPHGHGWSIVNNVDRWYYE